MCCFKMPVFPGCHQLVSLLLVCIGFAPHKLAGFAVEPINALVNERRSLQAEALALLVIGEGFEPSRSPCYKEPLRILPSCTRLPLASVRLLFRHPIMYVITRILC
jgi:hypothetical protein